MGQWVSSNHNDADAYVGSPLPHVTGSVALTTAPMQFNFPYVTRWVRVINDGGADIRVGFTANGVNANPAVNSNYFLLADAAGDRDSGVMPLKVDRLFVRADAGTSACSVIAGYTAIPKNQFLKLTGSEGFEGIG